MRPFFLMLGIIALLVLALGGLEAIASRSLPAAKPLPSAALPSTWY